MKADHRSAPDNRPSEGEGLSARHEGKVMHGLVTTPLGAMSANVDEGGRLMQLAWIDGQSTECDNRGAPDHVQQAIDNYFAHRDSAPSIELAPRGTSFQLAVWDAVSGIPSGTTLTYGQLAQRLGNPAGARAVGLANAKNPIAILIPCHRLIGSDGTLRGYAGGLNRKQSLLTHEAPG